MRSSFRFRGAAGLGIALVLLSSAVSGQDTTQTSEARVHVVERGETLWGLAQFYFGDPLLWPEIYRLNTVTVEDPHWIFPGEELLLAARDAVAVDPGQVAQSAMEPVARIEEDRETPALVPVDAAAPPPPSQALGPTVFSENRDRGEDRQQQRSVSRPSSRVSAEHFHSAGFLTEQEPLRWADVLGAVDRSTLNTVRRPTSARTYESIRLQAPPGAAYQIGDSLLTVVLARELPEWGEVVVPTGIVIVTSVRGREIQAEILKQFQVVDVGQSALPVEPFTPISGETRPIDNGLMAAVIQSRDLHPVPGPWDVLFIDKGRSDGVAVGDVFEAVEMKADVDMAPRQLALLRVLHVRNRSATVQVVSMNDIGLEEGAPVRLIRKIGS